MLDANIDDTVVNDDFDARLDEHDDEPAATGSSMRVRWTIAAAVAVVVAIVAIIVASMSGGSSDDAAPIDLTSPDLTPAVLDSLGSSSGDVVEGLLDSLVPGGLSAEATEALITEFAALLDGETHSDLEQEPADVFADGLVRRLGPAAGAVESGDELVAVLVAEIDPAGEVRDADDLRVAMTTWLETTSALTIDVDAGDGGDAFTDLGFDEAAAYLDAVGFGAGVVNVPIGGISGTDSFDLGGVSWTVDDDARTIVFTGSTSFGGGVADGLVALDWSAGSSTVAAALRLDGWTLGDVGVGGSLGEHRFGPITVAVSGTPIAEGGPVDRFVLAAHSSGMELLDRRSGVSVIGELPTSVLPEVGRGLIGLGDESVPIGAWLGGDLGAVTGASTPDEIVLAAAADLDDAPALPDWAQPSPDSDWRLVMTVTGGSTSFALDGILDVTLGGETRAFRMTIDAADGNAGSSVELTGALAEPWPAAFGIDWLELTSAALTVNGDGNASLSGDGIALGRSVGASIEVDTNGQVDASVSIDRLDVGEVLGFVASQTGVSVPDLGAALVFDDVTMSARSGDAGSLAIAATTEVFGQRVDALVSAARAGADSGAVLGLRVGAWSLGDAVPALADAVVADLEFPPTTFVLSSVEGSIAASELTAAQAQFFEGDVELRSGLSIESAVDLSGTALEAPLGALGFDGAVLPVSGTLPTSVLGGSGSGGSLLDALALRIALPDIDAGGAPDWFRGGRLAIEVTGSSAGLVGEMDVVMHGEQLTFEVGAGFVRQPLGYAMSVSGVLAGDRPWESPFGVSWLTLERVAFELSVQPTGSVGVGFAGTAVIAGRDIDAAIAVEMSPVGVPTNFLLSGSSAAGLSTTDLLAVQRAMADAAGSAPAGGGDRYPSLAIRDAEIRFAPRGSDVLGVEQGFVLAGEAFIGVGGAEQPFGSLDVRVSEDGLFAVGALNGYQLGPLAWSDIDLDLALSASAQRFAFDGSVELFGIGAEVEIDVSNDSIFFSDALDEIRQIVDLFETIVRDPAGAIARLPELYRAAGAPTPAWLDDVLDGVQVVLDSGAALTESAIDTVLNGGRISLGETPAGGDDAICPLDANFEENGNCYRTPSTAAVPGLPIGGVSPRCPSWAPRSQGGDCYSLLPDPCSRFEVICDEDGTPNGGTDKVCGIETPLEDDGRCYTTPPIPAIAAQPTSGVDRVCPVVSPFEEGGRCYIITPSAASVGIDVEGLCSRFGISCTIRDLLRGEVAEALADTVADRLDDW